MTTEEWIAKQRRLITELKTKNAPLELAARSTMALQAHRIFIDGENSSGGSIGQYDSEHPIYVNPEYAPRKTADKIKGIDGLLPTRGNPSASLIEDTEGEHTFIAATAHRGVKGTKAGDTHRTTWVKSYKEFKRRIGQKNDKVRLHLSGDFESDFRNAPVDSAAVNPKKISVNEYQTVLKRDENVDKLRGLTVRFGVFSNLTKFERSEFLRVNSFELRKLMAS